MQVWQHFQAVQAVFRVAGQQKIIQNKNFKMQNDMEKKWIKDGEFYQEGSSWDDVVCTVSLMGGMVVELRHGIAVTGM